MCACTYLKFSGGRGVANISYISSQIGIQKMTLFELSNNFKKKHDLFHISVRIFFNSIFGNLKISHCLNVTVIGRNGKIEIKTDFIFGV